MSNLEEAESQSGGAQENEGKEQIIPQKTPEINQPEKPEQNLGEVSNASERDFEAFLRKIDNAVEESKSLIEKKSLENIRQKINRTYELSEGKLTKEEILEKLGVERDEQGRLVFYHVTTAKNYMQIENDELLKPPIETGSRGWRLEGEKGGEKLQKLYLATRDGVKEVSRALQNDYGGSTYILEVHVDENNLRPDEDTGQINWHDGLYTRQVCSHMGNIDNYRVAEKLDFQLSKERRMEYARRSALAKANGLNEEAIKIRREFEEEMVKGAAQEEEELRKVLEQKELRKKKK